MKKTNAQLSEIANDLSLAKPFQRLDEFAAAQNPDAFNLFTLHYQPQYSLKSATLVGVEALIRWRSPDRALSGPGKMISDFEETGFIVPLTKHVLQEAISQRAHWTNDGLPEFQVSVNFSGRHLIMEGVEAEVMATLDRFNVAHKLLDIEITEGVQITNFSAASRLMNRLAGYGVTFSLDDFGTGASQLPYLLELPAQRIKLDAHFVNRLGHPRAEEIIRAITEMAHNLGLRVLAEGIDTKAKLATLTRLGVDEGQGYLLNRPSAPEEVGSFFYDL